MEESEAASMGSGKLMWVTCICRGKGAGTGKRRRKKDLNVTIHDEVRPDVRCFDAVEAHTPSPEARDAVD